MKISMYDAAVRTSMRVMANLAAVLEKGAQYAEARKIDPAVLVAARLAPDMFPLSRQVQIASDSAKIGVARLTGVTPPAFEDVEKSFPELIERTRKTIAWLETLTPAQFDGAEDRDVRWKSPVQGERSMQGLNYLLHHVLPNVHFHATTAYDILRHNGVELGKMDYLGRVPPA